jgi:Domain of unknown function (DUF4388)
MDEALQGTLSEGVLVNLMQYLAMNQSTGSLALRRPQGELGQLYFERGKVIHVMVGSHSDVRAMAMMLSWQDGTYTFHPHLSTAQTMRSSIERLLLEAVMVADISKKKGQNPFYEDSILTAKPLQKDQIVSLSIRAVQLLPQLDGLRTLSEIARAMRLELSDVVSAANELCQQGLTDNQVTTIAPEFIGGLKDLVVNIMGPMGEIFVDDVLYNLGVSAEALPKRVLPALLHDLEGEMTHARWRERFGREVKGLCQSYGIEPTATDKSTTDQSNTELEQEDW